MRRFPLTIVAVLLFIGTSFGQTAEKGVNLPMPPNSPKIAATVGDKVIPGSQIDKLVFQAKKRLEMRIDETLAKKTPEKRDEARKLYVRNAKEQLKSLPELIRNDIIFRCLQDAYIDKHKITATPEEIEAVKKQFAEAATRESMTTEQLMEQIGFTDTDLVNQARAQKLRNDATTETKLDAFIKANPNCFNGTVVEAQHILIRCTPFESTKKQKEVIAKLQQIKDDIQTKKISFKDAAIKYSEDPSAKENKGNLGEFSFHDPNPRNRMVKPFALAAFHSKAGEISPIVRTSFGFHIIQVTKCIPGKAEPDKSAKAGAYEAILAELQNQVYDMALTDCPIVIHDGVIGKVAPAEKK